MSEILITVLITSITTSIVTFLLTIKFSLYCINNELITFIKKGCEDEKK